MTVFPRRPGIASVAVLSGIALTLGALHSFLPTWTRSVGLDVWNLVEAETSYEDVTASRDELDATQDQLAQQMGAAEQVTAHLIAGHLTLPEAVAELDVINRYRPGFDESLISAHPTAPSHRARIARYALGKVRTRLESDPSRSDEVSARLEAEYRTMDVR